MIIIPPPTSQRRTPDRQQVQAAAANAGLELPDAAMLAFQQGRMIEGVRLVRAANPGLDLARAKAAIERMRAQAGSAIAQAKPDRTRAPSPLALRHPPTVAMGDPPGQLRWLLLVLALLAGAAWLLFEVWLRPT